jgi:hypothetical protein
MGLEILGRIERYSIYGSVAKKTKKAGGCEE